MSDIVSDSIVSLDLRFDSNNSVMTACQRHITRVRDELFALVV